MHLYLIAAFLFGAARANVFPGTNIALRKPVTASTERPGFDSQALVDGNPWSDLTPGSNTCTHTLKEENPYLIIDLLQSYEIFAIDLWTREKITQIIKIRDSNLEIRIGDNPDFTQNPVCKYLPGILEQQEKFECNRPLCGRYVSVQRKRPGLVDNMHVCELRTFTRDTGYICSGTLASQDMVSCTCSGDPHCRQFDFNQMVNFQGTCLYTMARDNCANGIPNGDPTWEVITNNDRNYPTEPYSRVRTVIVLLHEYDLEIVMKKGKEVFVNGEKVLGSPAEYANGKVVINITPQNVYLRVENGIRVTWNGATIVKVDMPTSYKDQSCGICGNYNGNNQDDWIIGDSELCMDKYGNARPGQKTSNLGLFGTSWTWGIDYDEEACLEECPNPPVTPGCTPVDEKKAQEHCAVLKDPNGPFGLCLKAMSQAEADAFYDACVYDACHLQIFEDIVCTFAEDMRKQCQANYGITPDYRSDDLCPMPCGEGMEYNSCGDPCLPTCSDRQGTGCGDADNLCEEGCFCKPGLVYNGDGKCVSAQQCGCLVPDSGIYINVGESFMTNNCDEICSCNSPGAPLSCVVNSCPTNMVCGLEDGERKCVCDAPFVLDGSNCVAVENPCSANEKLACWTCTAGSDSDCFASGKMEVCDAADPICVYEKETNLQSGQVASVKRRCGSRSTCATESIGREHCAESTGSANCLACYYGEGSAFNEPVYECQASTPAPPPVPDHESCFLPKEKGPCSESLTRFYFNPAKCKCVQFTYGGCDGNLNNFESKAACQAVCEEWEAPAECTMAKDIGPCDDYEIRYYFVPSQNNCKKFNYGGCGGNGNNFMSKDDCRAKCKKC